jgi:hypothetical protein
MPREKTSCSCFVLASFISIVVFIVLLSRYDYGHAPANPRKYLTEKRAFELKNLADQILEADGLTTLVVRYDFSTSSSNWTETMNGQPSTLFTNEVIPILTSNKFHLLRADAKRDAVIFSQRFFRNWYHYLYAPSGGLDAYCQYSNIVHITNDWYFVAD